MTHSEMEDQILRLTAQTLIMREFTAWFLASLSASTGSPDRTLAIRMASESIDRTIDEMKPTSEGEIKTLELARNEKDWIISAATKTLKGG